MDLNSKSRLLVTALRHKPEILNLKLDNSGWANTKNILDSLDITMNDLCHIHDTNNKKDLNLIMISLKLGLVKDIQYLI